ncbi:MAG TPA: histidinol-phosphate transaminase, partial [Phycisphaerales bacterium]|nr:histidinol-phosphate transaminase [Phycisphaerales bacterium]
AERVVVTAGGDDALMRLCLATIDPGCHAVSTTPTFEMIPRYVSLAGGILRQVPWTDGPFPVESFTRMIDGQTRAVFIVTPNNPTGLAATAGDLAAVANAAPHALMVVDLAYTEFAGEDLTPVAISLPNAVAVRTLSKAWGLAGLRVGYAVGDPTVIDWLRAVGQPYAVAGPSAAIASWAIRDLKDAVLAGVDRVREERGLLAEMLRHKGLRVNDSLANFVLARSPRARGIAGSLATHGIAVRAFPGRPGLEDGLRITCPGEAELFSRLVKALENST